MSESTVKKYKADLVEEVEPQIAELLERAKRGLKALERQNHTLKQKVKHSTMIILDAAQTAHQVQNVPVPAAAANRSASARIEARRLHVLTSQRQSLEQELEDLKEEIEALVSTQRLS